MTGIRVYSPQGRETWISRPGQTVPAGWLEGSAPFAPFTTEMVAVLVADEGNPYDQGPARRRPVLTLVQRKGGAA